MKGRKINIMNTYRIGLYNPRIEDGSKLQHCDKVYSSLSELKKHIRCNDTVELSSTFSIYEYNSKEIVDLIEGYNLNIIIDSNESSSQFNKLTITTITAMNEYIKNNEAIISKLLDNK